MLLGHIWYFSLLFRGWGRGVEAEGGGKGPSTPKHAIATNDPVKLYPSVITLIKTLKSIYPQLALT